MPSIMTLYQFNAGPQLFWRIWDFMKISSEDVMYGGGGKVAPDAIVCSSVPVGQTRVFQMDGEAGYVSVNREST
jgi:hypothetical protein